MSTVYITEQGAVVRQSSQHLTVTKGKETLTHIPLIKVDSLLLFGNVQLTTQAVNKLLDEGIDVAFLTMSGKLHGRLVGMGSKNVLLRIAQYERFLDNDFQLEIARDIVKGKIRNARTVIFRYRRNYPEQPFDAELEIMQLALKKLKNQTTINSLMGSEGIATAAYFRAFGRMFRKQFSFEKRTKRPPKDPVNAVLSLGYTLLTNEICSLLAATGFDPFIGILHGIEYGRPSLALDVVEEFRHPIIDRLTLNLFNNEMLASEDFRPVEKEGIYLKDESFKNYLRAYNQRMNETFQPKNTDEQVSYRSIIKQQVQVLAKSLKYRQPYTPFRLRF